MSLPVNPLPIPQNSRFKGTVAFHVSAWIETNKQANMQKAAVPAAAFFHLLLCRFFLSFFLRLWVAIFRSLRFLPQGTSHLLFFKVT